MSARRVGNRIRGPQSALTDFLAANNISAAQIRSDYLRRQQAANNDAAGGAASPPAAEADAEGVEASEEAAEPAAQPPEAPESSRRKKKGKDNDKEAAKNKKQDKAKAKAKKRKKGSDDDGDDDDDEDWNDLYRETNRKTKKLPGQLENCEVCDKRFTVTPYSKAGPDGGLLCNPCGKDLAKETGADKPKKSSAATRKRRKVESDRLDGRLNLGAKSLQQLCIEKVVKHHQDLEELGDLPEDVLERLGEIFTKHRVLKSDTLQLFLRGDLDSVVINDCAYFEISDFEQVFSTAQRASRFKFDNACQFQTRTMEYMMEKAQNLRHLSLYAANLVSDDAWRSFFQGRGEQLETLKLKWLDASFDLGTVTEMACSCTNLRRLKLYRCRQVDEDGIAVIATMKTLEHLSLHLSQPVSNDALVELVASIGKNLQTLSLIRFQDANDALLEQIHNVCKKLVKLRLADNDTFTDAGFVKLFANWGNNPLVQADFSSTRDVDNSNPDGPKDPVGLADGGLEALMQHSGEALEKLNISSCRHITASAFMDVFDGKNVYPELREIDLSFCGAVDTVVVAGIFKSCPKLKKLVVFGCFGVDSMVVPSGILVIGAPKAQDAIEQFGVAGLNVEQALGGMLQMIETAA